jgi:aldehyde dehydrogenase (NAD+)
MNEIEKVIHAQRKYFGTNETKNVDFRIKQLVKFKNILKTNEPLLFKAIYKDFNKSEFETYITELALLYHEINKCIKNIKKWSKEKKVSTGLTNFPAKSYIVPEPLGNTLIIGPWNYPYQLSLIPAISSIAAGNTVLLKPSELPSQTSSVMAKLINDNFPAEFIHVVEGGVEVATNLLEYRFDKIFFTGSIPVGKIVYKAAAENLTPVTLELGGKSPTFVLSDANIEVAAKRIIWAKFINAGQTCVAPDFILVDKSIEDKLINALISEVKNYPQSYNPDAENYLQIINTTNFDRLNNLIIKFALVEIETK